MSGSNGLSVAQALEIQMKKKVLVIGGFVAATLLVGSWALAQSAGHGPGGMRGMGMGMHGQMGQGMRSQWVRHDGYGHPNDGYERRLSNHGRAPRHPWAPLQP